MIAAAKESTSRSTLMRKIGGYGVAVAVTPYLLIKIAWTFGMFLPRESMGGISWRAINATTAMLALVGTLLAMAFSWPWGERLPAWAVIPPVWVGTGLLVPMVLLAPVLGPAAVARDAAAGAASAWAYEQVFVIASLVGVGMGLPVALAGYAKARWPEALGGPIDQGDPPEHTRWLQVRLARAVAAGSPFFTRGGGGRGSAGSSDIGHDEPTTDVTTGRRARTLHSDHHPDRSTT